MTITQQATRDALSLSERLVLILYYYEELSLKEIGAVLQLTENQVAGIRRDVIGRLKAAIAQ